MTNDDELARKIRLMKNFGFTYYDQVEFIGTNGKMNEVSAAMGVTNLESMDDFIAANHCNYHQYRRQLEGVPGIRFMTYNEAERCNYQYIILEIDEHAFGLNRDELQRVLWAENVLARRYFYPGCHRVNPYRSSFPNAGLRLPKTEQVAGRVLALPTGTTIEPSEVERICEIVVLAQSHGREVRATLQKFADEGNSR